MLHTEVIIAGAGPAGAIAGARLASLGVDVVVCEAMQSCAGDLRASTFHPVTLEMLDEIDAAQPLIERGLKAPVYQWRDRRSGDFVKFDMSELSDITRFPYRLQCKQCHLANLLTERLPKMGHADMRFNTRIVDVRQDDDKAVAVVEQNGQREEITAKYIIGADGAHSQVRKSLCVEFDGFTYDEKFLSVSTTEPLEEYISDISYVNYIADPAEWLVLLRMPEQWRILVPATGVVSDAELLSEASINSVFDRIVPNGMIEPTHRSIYRVHQRVAKSFRYGRIMLVGDAAHLNNPLGGYGMNSGIHDAWNLADKLHKILRQGGDEDLLDLFDRQRRGVTWAFVQAQTIENKAFMEHAPGEAHVARMAYLKDVAANPAKRRQHLLRQAMFQSIGDAENIS